MTLSNCRSGRNKPHFFIHEMGDKKYWACVWPFNARYHVIAYDSTPERAAGRARKLTLGIAPDAIGAPLAQGVCNA